jgi:hypothetical protein
MAGQDMTTPSPVDCIYIPLHMTRRVNLHVLFQATVGASEDGLMKSELLDLLFSGKTAEEVKTKVSFNGTAFLNSVCDF